MFSLGQILVIELLILVAISHLLILGVHFPTDIIGRLPLALLLLLGLYPPMIANALFMFSEINKNESEEIQNLFFIR